MTRALARRAAAVAATCACAIAFAAAAAPASPVEQAAIATETLRELRYLRPVTVVHMQPAAVREFLKGELETELKPGDAAWRVQLLATLDLLPADYPLREKLLDLLSEQVAGFYSASRKQLVIVDLPPEVKQALDKAAGGDALSTVLVHELDHALTDQHFDLGRLLEADDVRDRDDLQFARQALAEGDASLAMMLDGFRRAGLRATPDSFPSGDVLRQAMQSEGAISFPQLEGAPTWIRTSLVEPYLLGLDTVVRAWKRGGWRAVNDEWRFPPASTEQLLHPEKRGDAPVVVRVDGLLPGWTMRGSIELGELGIRTWLGTHLPADVAARAAAGWGGDRVGLFERPRTTPPPKFATLPPTETALLALTEWDTRTDADEFSTAAESWLRASTTPDDDWHVSVSGRRVEVFLARAATPVMPIQPIGSDPWDRPASTLRDAVPETAPREPKR